MICSLCDHTFGTAQNHSSCAGRHAHMQDIPMRQQMSGADVYTSGTPSTNKLIDLTLLCVKVCLFAVVAGLIITMSNLFSEETETPMLNVWELVEAWMVEEK